MALLQKTKNSYILFFKYLLGVLFIKNNFLQQSLVWCWCQNIVLRVSVLWWLLLLGGCVTNPFANLDEWKEIQSKNFIVYTNAPEIAALDVIKEFEVFRAIALKIITISSLEETDPVRVYLFKNKNSFAPFRPTENTAGYFISGENILHYMPLPSNRTLNFRLSIMNTSII